MGTCASVSKAMKAEAANDVVPPPQPPNDDSPATILPEKKAEDGDHAKHEEKAIELQADAPKEAPEEESEEPKPKAPAPLQAEAAAMDKSTEAAEQK